MTYKEFIPALARQMCMERSEQETEAQWYTRICYSGAARHMLAGLYDRDGETHVSVRHIKERADRFIGQLSDLFSETGVFFGETADILPGYLYSLFKQTGFFYHEEYRVVPAATLQIRGSGIMFRRGFFPSFHEHMSGAGAFFTEYSDSESEIADIHAAFAIQKEPARTWWKRFLQECRWFPAQLPEDAEFVDAGNLYWGCRSVRSSYTLARFGLGEKQYALYRRAGEEWEQAALPAWQVQEGEYRRVFCALLLHDNVLPSVHAIRKGPLIEIKIGCLLPPAEQNFLELYSWPSFWATEKFHRNRTMAAAVFPTFKSVAENLGFHIEEGA